MTTPVNAQAIQQFPLINQKKPLFHAEADKSLALLNSAKSTEEKSWIRGTLSGLTEAEIVKLQATILWQELRLFKKNKNISEQEQNQRIVELARLFNLEDKLPKAGSIPERFKALKQGLSKQGIVIPPYNERLAPIHKKIKETLHIYRAAITDRDKWKNNTTNNTHKKTENIEHFNQTITHARYLLLGLNALLHKPDASETAALINKLNSKANNAPLVDLVGGELYDTKRFLSDHKKNTAEFYTKSYGNIQLAFLKAMDLQGDEKTTLADLKNKNYIADPETEKLIKLMLDKLGSDKVAIRAYYDEVFKNPNFKHTPDNYRFILNHLLGKLREDFFKIQRTPTARLGLDESRKAVTLKHWKRVINRFSQKNALEGGVAHRRKFDIDFDTCTDLLLQLNNYLQDGSGFGHLKEQDIAYEKGNKVKQPLIVIQQKQHQRDLYEISLLKLRVTLLELSLGRTISNEKRHSLGKQIESILASGAVQQNEKALLNQLLIKLRNNNVSELTQDELGDLFDHYGKNKTLQERNNLLNKIKAKKHECLRKLKKLRYGLADTLEDNLLPYTPRVELYHWTYDHTTHFKKENERAWKTWLSRPAAIGSSGALTTGQALISIYAGICFFPLIGPWAFLLAGGFFTFTLFTNFILFGGATLQVLNQLLVYGDIWVGFKSKGGKLLMGLAWVTAMTLASIQGAMTFISAQAAIGLVGVFAPALVVFLGPAGLALGGIIAATTFIGFTALMYVSIAALMTGACNFLEKHFPEIAEPRMGKDGKLKKGWGADGLYYGLKAGLKRVFYTQPKNLGNESWLRGVEFILETKASQLWRYYWSNPTGDLRDVEIMNGKIQPPAGKTRADYSKAVKLTRIKNMTQTVVKTALYALGVWLIAFGTAALLSTWNMEIAALLTTTGIASSIASAFSTALVYTLPLAAWTIFSIRNTAYCFDWLSTKLSNGLNRFFYNPAAILLYHGPKAFAQHVWNGTKELGKSIGYGITHPWETLKSFGGFLLGLFVVGNTAANIGLVAKGAMMEAPASTTQMLDPNYAVVMKDFNTEAVANSAISYGALSFTANMMASKEWFYNDPARVHLYDNIAGNLWDNPPDASGLQNNLYQQRQDIGIEDALSVGEYAPVFSREVSCDKAGVEANGGTSGNNSRNDNSYEPGSSSYCGGRYSR